MPKHGISAALSHSPTHPGVSATRAQHRRAKRLMQRGEERKALQLLREAAALEPSGPTYCWLAEGLLQAGRPEEALQALKQALYTFRYDHLRGRARSVAQWILRLDPSDSGARKVQARVETCPRARERRAA